MPVDPYIARGVAPIDVTNTLAQVSALRQRDQSLQQDAQMNALYEKRLQYAQQQDASQAQQAEEDDAEWDQAYAAKDWGTMARLDPQTTQILWQHEQSSKPPAPITEQTLPSGRFLATQGGNPIGSPWAPPEPGSNVPSSPAGVLENEWFLRQPSDVQAKILDYKRGNSTPEITRTNAEARTAGAKAGERQAEIEKKVANAANMGDALDIAVTLIPMATGSVVGALADRAAGAFGFTPTGAEATASLRVLAAKVLENVPRMEGPQSNADAKMYKEAAGQLGDPGVTRGEKMAAIRTIRQLSTKYAVRNAGQPAGQPAAPPQTPKTYKTKGGATVEILE
jgi:hypothetical protein